MSQALVFNAGPAGPRMSQSLNQGWAVAAHDFGSNKHSLIAGCFSDTEGGDDAARDNAKFIAQMFNLREETGLTGDQIRTMLMAAPRMQAAIQAAIECGLVPEAKAGEDGAGRIAEQEFAADQLRAALGMALHAKE
ncbi:hypothetical protein [Comamonas testosteroni]|uniref:hypothetical protein n=1 Tax=Comamonas testosteroni TaxID=285 RepID=UPI0005B4DA7C|nr:hypothetical protein [Comamonas testosteroni]